MAVVVDPMNGEPAEYLFSAHDNRGLPGRFDYYRGANHHVFLGEIPANLGDHYAAGYQPIPHTETELARLSRDDAYRLDAVRRLVPAGDFLEIGPWIGLVAYAAKQAGYRVSAIEMSQPCVDLLNRVGIHATQANDPAKTLRDSGATYDVIGLWHSIEHMHAPWEVIAAASRALKPGGILVIAAPNPKSAQMRLFGRHWVHLDAPRHLHLLSADAYRRIGEDNGLALIDLTTDDELGRRLDNHGWVHQLQRWKRRYPFLRPFIRIRMAKWMGKFLRHDRYDGAGFTLVLGKSR